jgi:hypothetical protein
MIRCKPSSHGAVRKFHFLVRHVTLFFESNYSSFASIWLKPIYTKIRRPFVSSGTQLSAFSDIMTECTIGESRVQNAFISFHVAYKKCYVACAVVLRRCWLQICRHCGIQTTDNFWLLVSAYLCLLFNAAAAETKSCSSVTTGIQRMRVIHKQHAWWHVISVVQWSRFLWIHDCHSQLITHSNHWLPANEAGCNNFKAGDLLCVQPTKDFSCSFHPHEHFDCPSETEEVLRIKAW